MSLDDLIAELEALERDRIGEPEPAPEPPPARVFAPRPSSAAAAIDHAGRHGTPSHETLARRGEAPPLNRWRLRQRRR